MNLSHWVKNKTGLYKHVINYLINEFNITDINNGNDKIIDCENIIIKLTSTNNQKNNEESNDVTILIFF